MDNDAVIIAYISQYVISRDRLAAFGYHIVLLDCFGGQFQHFLAVYLLQGFFLFLRFLLVCLAASEGERDILFPVAGSRFVFQLVFVVFSKNDRF